MNQSHVEEGRFQLSVSQPHVVLPALLDRIERDGRQLANLSTRHASLEDVFVHVAGRSIDMAEEFDG